MKKKCLIYVVSYNHEKFILDTLLRIPKNINKKYNVEILVSNDRSQDNTLEEAKKFLKTCSYREVAIWLTRKTGRYISYVGLRKRVARDTASKTKEESQNQNQSQAVG